MALRAMHFGRRVRRLQMGTRKSLEEEAAEECLIEEQNHNDVLK
jgi:uncharacterized membrane protein